MKVTEVVPLLDAVQTPRSYRPPAFFAQIGGSAQTSRSAAQEILAKRETQCSGVADEKWLIGHPATSAVSKDLFTFFNFRLEGTDTKDGAGLTTRLFLPAAPEFRGDAAIAMRTDDGGCTRGLSLFLRRSFLSGPNGRDLLDSFLRQAFGPDELGAWSTGQASAGREEAPSARVISILRDIQASARFKGRLLTAYIGSAVTETGASWIRVDAW